ncbi:hypothetical protein ACEWY4_014812 [Coilia grayii]|uniref:USP domain-containing protein n=1 Tax=Coilia grayii TaxID=363190 RepID=A0ABD1JTE0_9TELE
MSIIYLFSAKKDTSRAGCLNSREISPEVERDAPPTATPAAPTVTPADQEGEKDQCVAKVIAPHKEESQAPSRAQTLSPKMPPVAANVVAPKKEASQAPSRAGSLRARSPETGAVALVRTQQLECRGLPNLGHTCYINATLQCLFGLQPLCTQLLQQEESWRQQQSALLLSSLVGLWGLRRSQDRELKQALLAELKHHMALRNRRFEGNSQNDAHEFLSECLLGLSVTAHTLQMGDVCYECPVDTLLSFQLQHIRSCRSCGLESRREESATYLSLQMVAQGTVQNSLELYFTETEVEYRCERCGGQVSSLRSAFHTLPQVLILHLKRFCPFTLSKIREPLHLDAELQVQQSGDQALAVIADAVEEAHSSVLPSFYPESSSTEEVETGRDREKLEGATTYALTSVLSHDGPNIDHGHYITDCREEGGLWINYDDEKVTPLREEAVFATRAHTAYLLFYVRKTLGS